MKAREMAVVTKKAIEKKNKEKPIEIFNDLISKMKSQAESGYNYINFCFSDSEEIVAQVIDMLEEEGYSIKRNEGPKKNLTEISWAKAVDTSCGFSIAWVGSCKAKADETGFCDKHKKVKCRCGRQAIRECDTTVGPFVCGFPTCGKCTHSH